MNRSAFFRWALLAASALLRGQLSIPQLGVARYADGSVHLIRGVAANLIVDSRAIATSADGVSFADSAGLLSARGVIRLIRTDGSVLVEYQSTEPLPVLNIDPFAQSAAAWLPSKHLLLRWNGRQFVETPIDDSSFSGRVTFVSVVSSKAAQFYVARADSSVARIAVSLPSGNVISVDTAPGARGRAFMQQGWILWQDGASLAGERPNGFRQTVALSQQPLPPADLAMERMSDHWLHVSSRSTGTDWAVYLSATQLNVFLLPTPVAEVVR